MATCCLAARDLTLAFDPHPPVFTDLNLHLGSEPVALVGPNGAGKSLLALCLTGLLEPTQGQIERHLPVAYLAQQAAEIPAHISLAAFLKVEAPLKALDRLLGGQGSEEDLLILNERWTLAEELASEFIRFGLQPERWFHPFNSLSGGEKTRLQLMQLARDRTSYLILDEPSNHLDAEGRRWLAQWLKEYSPGCLVVTHDQDLLQEFDLLLELRNGSLEAFGQGFDGYQKTRQQRLNKAQRDKNQAEILLKKERSQLQQEKERHQQRAARGRQQALRRDQPKILLDARKEKSEAAGGRIVQKHQTVMQHQKHRREEAARLLQQEQNLALPITRPEPISGCLVRLEALHLPRGKQQRPLDWQIKAGERWWLKGANGSGKSTLMAVLAGQLQPASGTLEVRASTRLLDQHLSLLDQEASAVANFQHLNPGWQPAAYRDQLAHLGIRGEKALKPCVQLSGGEQLKVALAACLLGPVTAPLLLLDEPDNHLDLDSQKLLAGALSSYTGSLIVVSHSRFFAGHLRCDQNKYLDVGDLLLH
ncbi:ATP-binding cassette domain-containing protein [Marinospirillum perlucidum]|uniref:ATP-binding cassette domain-containing protein n=1 Tax=Marinospirillum perlucidum TaxID=1982602 RepID=UPI000DF1AD15|nr:ATP-binding cassette domain-containing protein [Marinospirillum perlucidum]